MSKKVIFMGTPDFAVASLKSLIETGIDVLAVVTAPDRPAGRGQKLKASAVKEFALTQNIPVLQPEKLKSPDFIAALKAYQADLFVVVAFRMLPEMVWDMPKLGTINLHGSLLPRYRGAAPINWAVINGDTQTGVTTFFIEKEIDTGKIIDFSKIDIAPNDTAGDIHDRLMVVGAKLLSKTVGQIFDGTATAIDQPAAEATHAPKIFKPDCLIKWDNTVKATHNKIRGLSPYPTAYTILYKEGQQKNLKIFESKPAKIINSNKESIVVNEEGLFFLCTDGYLKIENLQLEGKTRMKTSDFLKGFDILQWHLANPHQ
ncbi:methionyl-tRNA formyltransferase [Putridiphycobacter roseus]|uniref:Methionyl-tRNA formyltransferase n=1 Tax=Putridiphycobacter roseus TaxID=2219161 RepID=A0A2W1N9N3_9FLAO|nr:methionyl-tRNA formyltransferase [Putridiphycobacter roseus]PZE15753.1 methionyl-tRNA formyltransferase [Putridiphycobacter roseus]